MDGSSDRELEALLRGALDARARATIGADSEPPPPRFAAAPVRAPRRLARWAAPLAAAAAVVAVVTGVTGLGHHSPADHRATSAGTRVPGSNAPAPASSNTVHIKLLNDDGATYGVGMPVIAYFSKMITDARPLQQATAATVDGVATAGAWYFERSDAGNGPIEAHFRLAHHWPANAAVTVRLPVKGLSAGGGLTYDDDLVTEFRTGPDNRVAIDGHTHRLTLTSGAATLGPFPVALSPTTRSGTALVMAKPGDLTMDVDLTPEAAHYAQRLTYGGEFLVAAPWNNHDIEHGIDSSNGSVDLRTPDAKQLFDRLRIGDLVTITNVDGPPVTIGAGFGDWNLTWTQWQTGGLVRTH